MEAEEREAKMNRKRQAGLRKRKVSEKKDVLEKVVEVDDIKEEDKNVDCKDNLKMVGGIISDSCEEAFVEIVGKSSDKAETCDKVKLEVSDKCLTESSDKCLTESCDKSLTESSDKYLTESNEKFNNLSGN